MVFLNSNRNWRYCVVCYYRGQPRNIAMFYMQTGYFSIVLNTHIYVATLCIGKRDHAFYKFMVG